MRMCDIHGNVIECDQGFLLFVSLLLGSVLFFLMPLSMYDSNPYDFPMVAFSEVLFCSAVLTAMSSLCIYVALKIVQRCSCRLLVPALALISGCSLAVYAQGNLIGVDYGVLDGRQIQWGLMRNVAIANSLILCVCVCAPAIIEWAFLALAGKCLRLSVPVFFSYVVLLCSMLDIANISAFDRKDVDASRLAFSVQYVGQKIEAVPFSCVSQPNSTEVSISLPDMENVPDKRLARLILHSWEGNESPSIIDVKI